MSTSENRAAMTAAFREITQALANLFDLYDVDPRLAQATAQDLGRIYREHLHESQSPPPDSDRTALYDLLAEIESASDDLI